MREKLIELLKEIYPKTRYIPMEECREKTADYLLQNGVVVLPCKVGQPLYRIYDNYFIVDDFKIDKIMIAKDHITVFDDSGNMYDSEFIGEIVFLTSEEAEKALEGSKQ